MRKLLRYISPRERLMAALGVLFVLAQVWLELKMPEYMSAITVLTKTPGAPIGDILKNGGWMLLCALGSMLASIATGYPSINESPGPVPGGTWSGRPISL